MKKSPENLYNQRLEAGEIRSDAAQAKAVGVLEALYEELMAARKRRKTNWFQRKTGLSFRKKDPPQGIYMYGGVGRGKSMLMDLLYACLPENMHKRRVHFHEFMIEVHDYINSRTDEGGIREGVDATLPALSERIAERSPVLCFDEFHVTDVADAMILGRLFTGLFDRGVVVVATSNWPPDRLYEGGLQRERFLPFIDLLKKHMQILHLDSPVDYRQTVPGEEGNYFYPLNNNTSKKLDSIFNALSENYKIREENLSVRGRKITALAAGKTARFSFSELCERPLGAEDYLLIANTYKTVFLEKVPKMGYDRRNEAKRFITLVDALYEHKTHLVMSAEAPPEKLYYGHDHVFEFERTLSRLKEMQNWTGR